MGFLRLFRFFINHLRNSARSKAGLAFCLCCVNCLFECIERAVKYFNKYAFVYVATHGTSFSESAAKTMELFQAGLVDALINDDLVGGVLFMSTLISGVCISIIAGGWAWGAC